MMQTPARVVQGAPITVTYQAVDADGEPSSTTDPGTVTVSITRADGTSIVTGAATTGAATTGTDSTRSYTISAAYTGTLDRLAVTWSAGGSVIGTTTVDVVGGVFITVAEIRTLEDSLSDPGQYLPDTLIRARRQIESLITRACGDVVAFVPTFAVTSNALVDRSGALAGAALSAAGRPLGELRVVRLDHDGQPGRRGRCGVGRFGEAPLGGVLAVAGGMSADRDGRIRARFRRTGTRLEAGRGAGHPIRGNAVGCRFPRHLVQQPVR
jgi:hypothetical protein